METIKLRDEFIKLGQALKAAGFVESGVDAKYAVQDGLVNSAGAATQIYGKNMARIRGMDQLARAAGRLIQNEIRELGD